MAESANEVNGIVTQRYGSRTILIIGGVTLIAIIAVAAVILSTRDVETLDPGSPEAMVQAYLQATLDGDDETASSYLGAVLRESCDTINGLRFVPDNARVVLRKVSVNGEAARVEVGITEGEGALGGSGWTHDETFRLERSGGTWVITRAPWPYYECGFS